MKQRLSGGLAIVVTLLAAAATPGAVLLMKDGFVLQGKVVQPRDFIVDPASGASFSIPLAGGSYFVDDGVRRIMFSPRQVQRVINEDEPKQTTLKKDSSLEIGKPFRPDWRIDAVSEFDDRWQRTLRITSSFGQFDMTQRITILTPKYMRVDSLRTDWIPRYFTRELGPKRLHALLKDHLQKQEMKELDKQKTIFQFLFQAGWHDYAATELKDYVARNPETESTFAELSDDFKRVQALTAFEALEAAHKAGQHEQVLRDIDGMYKSGMAKLLGEQLFKMQEIKNERTAMQEKLLKTTAALKELPGFVNALNRELFTEAAAGIAEELSHDSLGRLELFTSYAEQFAREVKDKRAPSQSADKVLALAISGWLQGNNAAAPDVPMALALWQTRKMVLATLGTHDATNRTNQMSIFAAQHKLPIDVIARMIPMLPPAEPHKLEDTVFPFELTPPTINGEKYLVLLPPEYTHNRPYPLLLVLHSQREQPAETLNRFRELAARHGYILAAPTWGQAQQRYGYTEREQEAVLGCLRDLRRRFAIDSDRVFLFGFEEGATAAFDIGLSKPHEFAGVLPMSGDPAQLPMQYWPNAQYLPFYVVDGGFSDSSTKANNEIFKKWVRFGYPSLYFEYKGRLAEWFAHELPAMFDWMGRKKRANPSVQLGTYHTSGGLGEEFCTARPGDDRFYWLGTSSISPAYMYNPNGAKVAPATLQARIATGNDLIKRSDSAEARIWNQIDIRARGVSNAIVWLGPNMIDFTKPVLFRVNSQQIGRAQEIQPSLETMLEEVYRTGDRQRLYFARIDVRSR